MWTTAADPGGAERYQTQPAFQMQAGKAMLRPTPSRLDTELGVGLLESLPFITQPRKHLFYGLRFQPSCRYDLFTCASKVARARAENLHVSSSRSRPGSTSHLWAQKRELALLQLLFILFYFIDMKNKAQDLVQHWLSDLKDPMCI